MSAIARRRVAGATALLIMLYLLQVVLSSPPAHAVHVDPILFDITANRTCGELLGGGGWTEIKFDPNTDGTQGPVTISNTQNDKTFDWSSTVPISGVYVKAGSGGSYLYVYNPPSLGDTGLTSPGAQGNQISHVSFCYKQLGDADVQVAHGCNADDQYVVTFTTSNATIAWTVNGAPATVTSGQVLAAGTTVSWTATANVGFTLVGGADVSGGFTAMECGDQQPGDADVQVQHECNASNQYVVTFTTSNASIAWTVNGAPATVTSGQVLAAGTTVSWTATADAGFAFVAGADVTGGFTALDCADTRPPQTPTPTPTVQVDVTATCIEGASGSTTFVVTMTPAGAATVHIPTVGTFTQPVTLTGFPDATVYSFTVTPSAGFALSPLTPTSGSFDIPDCDLLVAGTTIVSTTTSPTTTVPEVVAETLPFTGDGHGETVRLALLVFLAGTLLLYGVREREEDRAAPDQGGWSSY